MTVRVESTRKKRLIVVILAVQDSYFLFSLTFQNESHTFKRRLRREAIFACFFTNFTASLIEWSIGKEGPSGIQGRTVNTIGFYWLRQSQKLYKKCLHFYFSNTSGRVLEYLKLTMLGYSMELFHLQILYIKVITLYLNLKSLVRKHFFNKLI